MSSPEQQVITLKDSNRLTAACDACRERKRKCDGKAPCHFCVSRRITCQYSQRKKRGPPVRKKQEENNSNNSSNNNVNSLISNINVSSALTAIRNISYSLGSADLEYGIFNQAEMNKYINFYVRYMNVVAPICNAEKLTAPDTNEHQVQSYAVVAIASRMCGDLGKSKMCIGSARQLAGMIFDSPQKDAAVAMLLMSTYFQMDLDFAMTSHYINLSYSLLKLLPMNYSDVLYMFIYSNYLVMDNNLTNRQKEQALRNLVNQILATPESSKQLQFFAKFLRIAVILLQAFDSNIFWPVEDMETNYQKIYNKVVSEQDRLEILSLINSVQTEIEQLDELPPFFLTGFQVFTGVVKAIADWKSGHDLEALSHALQVSEGLHILHENNCLGFAADFMFICLLVQMIQYYYEHNYAHQAAKLSEFIRTICRIMGPGYNFVVQFMDKHNFRSISVETPLIAAADTNRSPVYVIPEFFDTPSPGSVSSPYSSGNEGQPIALDHECDNTPYTSQNNGLSFDNLESMLTDLDNSLPNMANLLLIDLDNITDPSVIIENVSFP